MYQRRKKSRDGSTRLIKTDVLGEINKYNYDRGYGFITEQVTQRSVFFHKSVVLRSTDWGNPIKVGGYVMYDLYLAPKGYTAKLVSAGGNGQNKERRKNCEENLIPIRGVIWTRD